MSEASHGTDIVPIRFRLPSTVSAQWTEAFGRLVSEVMKAGGPQPQPLSNDADLWAAYSDRSNAFSERLAAPVLARLGTRTNSHVFGNVPVLEYVPRIRQPHDGRVIYIHGGGFTGGSSTANAVAPAVIADLLSESVLSIDYTVTPRGRFDTITDEVVAVFDALASVGIPADKTVIYGDSAGGCLAVASTLKLRDQGKLMRAALALWSPCVDLRFQSDTIRTLLDVDFFDMERLAFAVNMYAGPNDLEHPYASPILGDFSGGFPPTLVQAGTREMLLSDSVRLYQAMDVAGCSVKLDIYEGMPHVHQAWPTATETPEAIAACQKTARFLQHWLNRSTM